MKNKNLLVWAIHNGTYLGRDIGNPKPCKSLSEAKKIVNEFEKKFNKIGYMIWLANWWDANGKCHTVHFGNNNYH